ncbi:MAG: hypothetical protein U1E65_31260 [Myxococcota bacterium]
MIELIQLGGWASWLVLFFGGAAFLGVLSFSVLGLKYPTLMLWVPPMALLPWVIGALGTRIGLAQLDAALGAVAPEMASVISAAGLGEAHATRILGAAFSAVLAGFSGLGIGVSALLRPQQRASRAAIAAGLLWAAGLLVAAAWHASESGNLLRAMSQASPDDLPMLATVYQRTLLGSGTAMLLVLVGAGSAAAGLVLERSPRAIVASAVILGLSGAGFMAGAVMDARIPPVLQQLLADQKLQR